MEDSEIKWRNRKIAETDKEILEQAVLILSSNKSYYWNKHWVLKYRKND